MLDRIKDYDTRSLAIISFNIVIALCYFGVGLYVIFSHSAGLKVVAPLWRNIFGVACLAYGAFRVWRAWHNIQTDEAEAEDDSTDTY